MAGVIGFITSFFDNSEKAEEAIDQEEIAEADMRITEVENLEDSDDNQQFSPEDRLVCKFFLEGKCRFGEKCKNIHEAGQGNAEASQKSRRKQNIKADKEEIINKKKPSMRTAEDVKNRILWDPMLPEEFFIIGYLDRFLGIKEESFSTFSWEHLASVDYDVLAIPQHRIQYFKYKSEKVWDKSQRLDVVFGSTGSKESICELMERVDREIIEKREEHREEDDSDSEEEEDAYYSRPSVTLTMTERVNTDNNVNMIAEEDRSTHFIAIKINNKEIVTNLMKVQESIMAREELLQECCMKRGLFHITIAMLRIRGEEGLDEARQMMQRLEAELRTLLEDRSRTVLTVRGLNNFGQRVVYGEVEAEEPELLASLVTRVKRAVVEAGPGVSLNDKFGFVPHVTLAKVSRPVARMRRSKYIDSGYYEAHINDTFGQQNIDNLQLCVIDSSTRYDGFYSTLTDLQF